MRRTFLLLAVQLTVILAVIGLSVTGGSAIQAQGPEQSFTQLDGYNIYFSEENREATPHDRSPAGLSRFAGLLQALGANIHTLDWRSDIPDDADLVVSVYPTRDMGADQTARLWAFFKRGGALLLVLDPLSYREEDNGTIITQMNDGVLRFDRGFFELTWPDFGVRSYENVVVTEADDGTLSWNFETSNVASDHPVLRGVEGPLSIAGARSVQFDASIQPYTAEGLIFTEPGYYGESAFVDYLQLGAADYTPGDEEEDTPRGELALAVASELTASGARMIVMGDADFLQNGGGFLTAPPNTASFVHPANVQFAMNAVAWLVGADQSETETFAFPTAGATMTPTAVVTLTPTPEPEPTSETETNNETSG